MNIIDRLFDAPQYSLARQEKCSLLIEELRRMTGHHYDRCEPYRHILDTMYKTNGHELKTIGDIQFIPVRLFKTLKLRSISDNKLLKVLTSSGTTSQQVSQIAVDKETSILQTKALVSIVTSFIGTKRLPMIIIDSRSVLKDRSSLSARGVGLVGLSNFGHDHFYALNDEMRLDIAGLKSFIEKHRGERILLFGFTFMVWQYFLGKLHEHGEKLSLNNAILIHSGGWKKLHDQSVSNEKFKEALRRCCGIHNVYNFYSMVEQVGSIYMECEQGYLHTPNFAEILIRDYHDWSVLPDGTTGIIQTLSVLPRSYPGHSLLTEDLGTVHGADSCPCGRKGTYFRVQGRIPQAELRGCSDVHAYEQLNGERTQL